MEATRDGHLLFDGTRRKERGMDMDRAESIKAETEIQEAESRVIGVRKRRNKRAPDYGRFQPTMQTSRSFYDSWPSM